MLMSRLSVMLVALLLTGCVTVASGQGAVISERGRALLADIDQRGMTWEVSARGTIYPMWDDTGQMMTYSQWVTGYYELWPELTGGAVVPGTVVIQGAYVRLVPIGEARPGWVGYAVVLSPAGVAASE